MTLNSKYVLKHKSVLIKQGTSIRSCGRYIPIGFEGKTQPPLSFLIPTAEFNQ